MKKIKNKTKTSKKIQGSFKSFILRPIPIGIIIVLIVAIILSRLVPATKNGDSRVLALHPTGGYCYTDADCLGYCNTSAHTCQGDCKVDTDCTDQKCKNYVCTGHCGNDNCCTKRGCGYKPLAPEGCDSGSCYELDGFSKCRGYVDSNGECTYYGKQCVGK